QVLNVAHDAVEALLDTARTATAGFRAFAAWTTLAESLALALELALGSGLGEFIVELLVVFVFFLDGFGIELGLRPLSFAAFLFHFPPFGSEPAFAEAFATEASFAEASFAEFPFASPFANPASLETVEGFALRFLRLGEFCFSVLNLITQF